MVEQQDIKKLRNQFIVIMRELGYGATEVANVFDVFPQQVAYLYDRGLDNMFNTQVSSNQLEEYVKVNYLRWYVNGDKQGYLTPSLREETRFLSEEYLEWASNTDERGLKAELARIYTKLEYGDIKDEQEVYELTLIIALLKRKLDIVKYMKNVENAKEDKQRYVYDEQIKKMSEVFEKKEKELKNNVETLEKKHRTIEAKLNDKKRSLELAIAELKKEYNQLVKV